VVGVSLLSAYTPQPFVPSDQLLPLFPGRSSQAARFPPTKFTIWELPEVKSLQKLSFPTMMYAPFQPSPNESSHCNVYDLFAAKQHATEIVTSLVP
jgi:hypothetical protein